ncbi:dihydrodipicolinate synthase family protein [Herbiconiux daphne]|uniref:Dihydrodipicolinate synthase family protein n=1 Tax=Herbiconiux daphne TaxID=2970914 RepID=A0ABT2GYF9_9MICO|nr:dihydrodipicolinate synthase family protein [Herbiconiux daphne]MCS5732996.1 dihydrodipicolinate synthase family protein [Herbiconiux daphne]
MTSTTDAAPATAPDAAAPSPAALGTVSLPTADGWREIELNAPRAWVEHPQPYSSRVAFAAAHVVADPHGDNVPGAPAAIDWEATLAFRRNLFRYGLGVAEAMDTAQRNMGLDWPAIRQLISRSAAQAKEFGARIASGAGTDHLLDAAVAAAAGTSATLADVQNAYLEQVAFVEGTGSQVIVMASRHLARAATGPDDYLATYDRILSQVSQPVVLHWLGEAFDPQLAGYWGSTDVAAATDTFLELVRAHAGKVDGVKVSLLDASHEVALRRALPAGVRLYTGDDFNYPELIRGDDQGHSDALLGAFAAIAPAASAALAALDDGDLDRYDAEMAPTLELSRHIFEAPTFYYKVGIAFTSWLTGQQNGFQMVGGLQSARSLPHLARVFELLNGARLLPDPELAAHRLGLVAATLGATR